MKTGKTKLAFYLIILSTLFITLAQILMKVGINRISDFQFTFDGIIAVLSFPLIAGIVLYAISAGILIFALKHGDLSLLYPLYATSYIWVVLVSYLYFKESLTVFKILGVLFIIAGVFFLNREIKVTHKNAH